MAATVHSITGDTLFDQCAALEDELNKAITTWVRRCDGRVSQIQAAGVLIRRAVGYVESSVPQSSALSAATSLLAAAFDQDIVCLLEKIVELSRSDEEAP